VSQIVDSLLDKDSSTRREGAEALAKISEQGNIPV
jgi:hypothetical protein